MKILYILLGLVFVGVANRLTGQTVVSSCAVPDSTAFHLYASDAQRLAERRVFSDSSSYRDSLAIPNAWSDSTLEALMAVYNAITLPARDSVVNLYPVHSLIIRPNLQQLVVDADTTLAWMLQLKAGHLNTGNAQVDSLISFCHFTIGSYTHFDFGYDEVILNADTNYNIQAVANRFTAITGVVGAYPNPGAGDGSDITDTTLTDGHIQLQYTFGWGDCPSGCIYRHYWTFLVDSSCSVQFAGSGGDSITVPPVTAIRQIENEPVISIYPNPTQNQFILKTNAPGKAVITNVLGQTVWQQEFQQAAQANVQVNQTGVYLATVQTAHGIFSKKIWVVQ